MNRIREYWSDFGVYYVQVLVNGENTELAFNHIPTDDELNLVVLSLIETESIELEAENGAIE